MSSKRARRSLALRRAASGLVLGGLSTTLVVSCVERRGRHTEAVAAVTATAPTAAHPVPAILDGTFDVTVTVASAEYGASWPSPALSAGQQLGQRWTIACGAATCKVTIASGHVAEDPDGATLSTSDGRTFTVSASTAATPDVPSLPVGCGAVNATDVQLLTLTAAGSGSFTGHYSLHHPTIHVEGPVGDRTGSCDSFNVELDLAGHRL